MTNCQKDSTDPFPPGALFRTISQETLDELAQEMTRLGHGDIAVELRNVLIPLQVLNGTPSSFSFMAYAVPRLTLDQRKSMAIQDVSCIETTCLGGRIRIELDDFGKINWFYVDGLPALHSLIQQSIQENSNRKPDRPE
jgi:hypothetical protein